MTIVVKTCDETYIIAGVESFQVQTKHGLVGYNIPVDEGVQGFEFTENIESEEQ